MTYLALSANITLFSIAYYIVICIFIYLSDVLYSNATSYICFSRMNSLAYQTLNKYIINKTQV